MRTAGSQAREIVWLPESVAGATMSKEFVERRDGSYYGRIRVH